MRLDIIIMIMVLPFTSCQSSKPPLLYQTNGGDYAINRDDYDIHGKRIDNYYIHSKIGDRRDAVEIEPKYKQIFAQIDDEVELKLQNHKRRKTLGFVHVFWITKKEILLQKYGVVWRTPAELNPSTSYD